MLMDYIIDPWPLTALPPRKPQTLKWLYSGGTVVHISSGVSGLVAGGIVGPRRHVDKELGAANAPFVILGGCFERMEEEEEEEVQEVLVLEGHRLRVVDG